MKELSKMSKKVTSVDYNNRMNKPHFLNLYEDESETECIKSNNKILEAFYVFIIIIIRDFLIFDNYEGKENISDNESIPESRIPSFVINIEEEEYFQIADKNSQLKGKSQLAKKSGEIFREKFKNTSKYYSFVIKFCLHNEANDVSKIPYIFINEFIYYSKLLNEIDLMEINIIEIIEQFYGNIKALDFEEIRKKKLIEFELSSKLLIEKKKEKRSLIKQKIKSKIDREIKKEKEKEIKNRKDLEIINFIKKEDLNIQNIYLFSFDNFSNYYQNNLRIIINREQEDDKENFCKVRSINRQYKRYKRNNYFLSQNILNFYITFINNNLKELINVFKLIKYKYGKPEKDEINNSQKLSSININYNFSKDKNKLLDSEDSKNEKIDDFYLLQYKSNIDKALKEKLFGTYDILEISNIIESNLIIKRYFSSYTIIKYSLLNVLAVTREIESKIISNQNIIQIICEFCKITKLESKKYINIYLDIFKVMYQNDKYREKFKIKECLNQIFIYLGKNNIFLSEENEEFLNNVKEQAEPSEISLINDIFKEFINKKGKFFEMKESIFYSNKRFKFENAIKAIETIYLGKYEDKIDFESKHKIKTFDFNYNELYNLYKENIDDKSKTFFPKTPILLYDSTNKILKKYLTNFSYKNIPYKELYYDIISLLFYFKIPIIGDKWIDNIKRIKIFNKEHNLKSDVKTKKGEDDKNIINDKILENEVSEINISKNNIVIDDNKRKDINYELNEILKKIISILYDLFYNIKEKYKS